LYKEDVYAYKQGIKLITTPPPVLNSSFEKILGEYKDVFENDLYVAATRRYSGDDNKYLHQLAQLSKRLEIKMVATNDVHYHHPQRRQLQDVLTCIREKCTIQTAGFRLYPNAERHLKPVDEMLRLFRHYPRSDSTHAGNYRSLSIFIV
jgi:error-prone DNA polymerase